MRSGRDIAKVSKYSEVKSAGNIRIAKPKSDGAKHYIVFDIFPSLISDYTNHSLRNGDKIGESEIKVFDLKAFREHIK